MKKGWSTDAPKQDVGIHRLKQLVNALVFSGLSGSSCLVHTADDGDVVAIKAVGTKLVTHLFSTGQ